MPQYLELTLQKKETCSWKLELTLGKKEPWNHTGRMLIGPGLMVVKKLGRWTVRRSISDQGSLVASSPPNHVEKSSLGLKPPALPS